MKKTKKRDCFFSVKNTISLKEINKIRQSVIAKLGIGDVNA